MGRDPEPRSIAQLTLQPIEVSWSPDGSRLLFTMGPLRQRPVVDLPYADLWLYDVASGELEQLTLGGGFDGLGVWSP